MLLFEGARRCVKTSSHEMHTEPSPSPPPAGPIEATTEIVGRAPRVPCRWKEIWV